MGKKQKNRLPDKQSNLVHDFYPKNEKQEELVRMIEERYSDRFHMQKFLLYTNKRIVGINFKAAPQIIAQILQ